MRGITCGRNSLVAEMVSTCGALCGRWPFLGSSSSSTRAGSLSSCWHRRWSDCGRDRDGGGGWASPVPGFEPDWAEPPRSSDFPVGAELDLAVATRSIGPGGWKAELGEVPAVGRCPGGLEPETLREFCNASATGVGQRKRSRLVARPGGRIHRRFCSRGKAVTDHPLVAEGREAAAQIAARRARSRSAGVAVATSVSAPTHAG
jgi:hypothetical protein